MYLQNGECDDDMIIVFVIAYKMVDVQLIFTAELQSTASIKNMVPSLNSLNHWACKIHIKWYICEFYLTLIVLEDWRRSTNNRGL